MEGVRAMQNEEDKGNYLWMVDCFLRVLMDAQCDGESPCKRCKDDGLVCTAGSRKKTEFKQLPRGRVSTSARTNVLSWTWLMDALQICRSVGEHTICTHCHRPEIIYYGSKWRVVGVRRAGNERARTACNTRHCVETRMHQTIARLAVCLPRRRRGFCRATSTTTSCTS